MKPKETHRNIKCIRILNKKPMQKLAYKNEVHRINREHRR